MATVETYTIGHGAWAKEWMQERSVDTHARFLLPHLRPGLALLDCGCGPGSLTLDLAQIVYPGQVVGVDISPSQVAAAKQLAATRAAKNVHFESADVYDLPFESETFDVVHAQSLLMHLRMPARALAEIRRVVRPGGLVGIRDPDYGALLISPDTAEVKKLLSVFVRVVQCNGGSPFYARHLRQLLREAGFEKVVAGADALAFGSDGMTGSVAKVFTLLLSETNFRSAAKCIGVTEKEIESLGRAIEDWSCRPDAYYCMLFCEAVGWRGES